MSLEIEVMVRVSGKYGYEIYEDSQRWPKARPLEKSRFIYGSYESAHAAATNRRARLERMNREVG